MVLVAGLSFLRLSQSTVTHLKDPTRGGYVFMDREMFQKVGFATNMTQIGLERVFRLELDLVYVIKRCLF